MKKLLTSLLLIMFFGSSFNIIAQAAISDWQKGANIQPRSAADFGTAEFKSSVDRLKSLGANYVTLVIPYKQSTVSSHDISTTSNTPTDESLISAINYAHSIGMKVMLKPHIEVSSGDWRGNIKAINRSAWFSAYGTMIKKYALIAKNNNVEQLCIGTELVGMATNTQNPDNTTKWKNLITEVRGIYSGKLTYGANWGTRNTYGDEKNHILFWSELDFIGLSAYFPQSLDGRKGYAALYYTWRRWNYTDINELTSKYQKPLLFTEIGYRSITDSYKEPWNWSKSGIYNETDQADAYRAFFMYWNAFPTFAGTHIWEWSSNPLAGGEGDTSYIPAYKRAETIIAGAYGGTVAPMPAPTRYLFNSWSNTTEGQTGVSILLTVNVQNRGLAVTNSHVDFEIYNAQGTRVLQHVADAQNFSQLEKKSFQFNWTPSQAGTYTLKTGVFSTDWSQLYTWNNQAQVIRVK